MNHDCVISTNLKKKNREQGGLREARREERGKKKGKEKRKEERVVGRVGANNWKEERYFISKVQQNSPTRGLVFHYK